MYSQHHRFQIWNLNQHPFSHPADTIAYAHSTIPGVTNLGSALDWLFAVLYPNSKESVADVASLPAAGNTLLDYRVVLDDGDGKAASYRWEQREGDVAPKWYKIYDMDWGEQSILSNFLNQTQDVYAYKPGMDDLDDSGTPYAGDLAGQRIYGGASANTNLILYANSGDGVGPNTGSIFAGDNLNPLEDNAFVLGTAAKRWSDVRAIQSTIGNISIAGASILSSTGAISFGDENLSTSGTYAAGSLVLGSGSITDSSGAIDFGDDDISTSGDIAATDANVTQLNTENIYHGGALAETSEVSSLSGTNAVALTFQFSAAQTFVAVSNSELVNAKFRMRKNTTTGGNIYARIRSTTGGIPDGGPGAILASSNPIDSLTLPVSPDIITFTFPPGFNFSAGTVYAVEVDGSELIAPQGSDVYFSVSNPYVSGEMFQSLDDGASWSAYFGTDLNFEVNVLAASGQNGVVHAVNGVYGASNIVDADIDGAAAIALTKLEALTGDRAVLTDGSGVISVSPVTATELGYLDNVSGPIQTQLDGKANTALSNLQGVTSINSDLRPNVDNLRILGSSTNRWAGIFAEYISNASLAVSTDTLLQFRNATGVSDGQTLFWDNATSRWLPSDPDTEIDHGSISGLGDDDHLQYLLLAGRSGGQTILGSTVANEYLTLQGSSISSGGVRFADSIFPDATANLRNIGSSGLAWRNIYMEGEIIGGRVQNTTSGSIPAASGLSIGRLYWLTDTSDLVVDTGVSHQRLSQENIVVDMDNTIWDGATSSHSVIVSARIEDARKAIWAFYDVNDGYKQIYAELSLSSTQVTIDVAAPLPAGNYRLVGIR